MLNARYIASLSDDLVELYAQLEYEIKKDIFKRLNKMKKTTDASVWQMEILQQSGGLKSDILQLIEKYDLKAREELKKLYAEAMTKATKQDLKYYPLAKRELSKEQTQIINASVDKILNAETINKTFFKESQKFEKIYQSLTRMTMTVADATQYQFIKECNAAYMKVVSGGFDWKTAYRSAVNHLARDGVKAQYVTTVTNGKPAKELEISGNTIRYSSNGTRPIVKHYSIESATKMNVLTGINNAASQQTLENADNLGTDLVEVSAHIGARPEHEAMQGKVYCLHGDRTYVDADGVEKYAPDFYSTCKFGEPDGICGINCRHSFYPYFEGTPLLYSNKELDEMKEQKVSLYGKEVSPYEAEQELRKCERNIRNSKTLAMGFELVGDTENNPAYIYAREQIYTWQQHAKEISDETGLKRHYINEFIGTKDGNQPKGLKPKEN